MYARGILFGKMKYELGDHSFVRCPELGLVADIEFKTKGYWSGVYDAIGGTVKNEETGEVLYELSGLWTHEMFVKNVTVGPRDLGFLKCGCEFAHWKIFLDRPKGNVFQCPQV